jgi:hypothetical protein
LAFRAISNPEFLQQGGLTMLGQESIIGDYNYYQYDPLVLFSAIYSTFDFIKRLLLPAKQFNSYLKFLVFSWLQLLYRMSTIAVIMLSYLSILQRLPILLVLVSAIGLVAICIPYSFKSKNSFSVFTSFFLIGLAIYFVLSSWLLLSDYYDMFTNALLNKMELQGGLVSHKNREFIQILKESMNFKGIFLGQGLGSTYYNQELESTVRFTHNVVSYIILKFGYIGLGFSLITALRYIRSSIHPTSQVDHSSGLRNALYSYSLSVALPAKIALICAAFVQPFYKVLSFPFILAAAFA